MIPTKFQGHLISMLKADSDWRSPLNVVTLALKILPYVDQLIKSCTANPRIRLWTRFGMNYTRIAQSSVSMGFSIKNTYQLNEKLLKSFFQKRISPRDLTDYGAGMTFAVLNLLSSGLTLKSLLSARKPKTLENIDSNEEMAKDKMPVLQPTFFDVLTNSEFSMALSVAELANRYKDFQVKGIMRLSGRTTAKSEGIISVIATLAIMAATFGFYKYEQNKMLTEAQKDQFINELDELIDANAFDEARTKAEKCEKDLAGLLKKYIDCLETFNAPDVISKAQSVHLQAKAFFADLKTCNSLDNQKKTRIRCRIHFEQAQLYEKMKDYDAAEKTVKEGVIAKMKEQGPPAFAYKFLAAIALKRKPQQINAAISHLYNACAAMESTREQILDSNPDETAPEFITLKEQIVSIQKNIIALEKWQKDEIAKINGLLNAEFETLKGKHALVEPNQKKHFVQKCQEEFARLFDFYSAALPATDIGKLNKTVNQFFSQLESN